MPAISVIMPVHDSAPYLRECLDSVAAQTVTDWECLCVDDGSTDGSGDVLDEYAARDSRFRVFHIGHSNAGAARNFALDKVRGEFLAFLDSDDVFSPWLFETLFAEAEGSGADIVTCTAMWFQDGTPTPEFSKPSFWTDCTPDADWSKGPLSSGTMPWNKLIRRTLVENQHLRFLEQSSTNDLTFMGLALGLSRKTRSSNLTLVAYRQRTHSIQAHKSRNPLNCLSAMSAFLDGLKERGQWQKLSPMGRKSWFRFYVGNAIFELRSQTTFKGYRTLYNGLIGMDRTLGLSREFPPDSESDDANVRRYRAIVGRETRERFYSFFMALLAPLTGNRNRVTGSRAFLIKLTDFLAILLFPWRHIQIRIK